MIPLFRNLEIGNSPGEFRMNDRIYRPVSQQTSTQPTQNSHATNQNRNQGPSLLNQNLQNVNNTLPQSSNLNSNLN